MFRLQGPGERLDPSEERKKVRENVKTNLIAFIAVCTILRISDIGPLVCITQGELRGRYFTTDGGVKVNSFQGIPYARPPLGKLRFQVPEPAEHWQGIRDATKEGGYCTQKAFFENDPSGTEDCLYLNVYTPSIRSTPLPVMFWVHGGGFVFGSGNTDMHGPDYLVEQDVVVVTINYRLGPLGFLSLETEKAPGNVGLKDQVAALRWVRDNISIFGGDPDNVTVFGVSAGGASVHYLMVTDSTKGLFHKAISHSGSALNPWTLQTTPRQRALAMCTVLGHPTTDLDDAFEFLQSVSAKELVLAQDKILTPEDKRLSLGLVMVPSIENEFPGIEPIITEDVLERITKGKFHNVPYITGFNSSEGMIFLRDKKEEYYRDLDTNFEQYLPPFVPVELNTTDSKKIAKTIRNFYFKDAPITSKTIQEYVTLMGDTEFVYGIYKTAQIHASLSSSPTWVFRYSFEGYSTIKMICEVEFTGACHGDDATNLFKAYAFPIPPAAAQRQEKPIKWLINMWTNFAKTGNPTPQTSDLIPVKWEPVTKGKFNYLEIGEELSLKQNPESERMDFWDELLRSLT